MPATTKVEGASSSELALIFDCTTRMIETLAKKGTVVRMGYGRYDKDQSTRNYIRQLREQAAGRVGHDPRIDGVAANVKFKDAAARLLDLKIRKQEAALVAAADVRDMWGILLRGLRQFVLSIPGKVAFEVPTLEIHDREVIDRICRDGLEDAALGRGFDFDGAEEKTTETYAFDQEISVGMSEDISEAAAEAKAL